MKLENNLDIKMWDSDKKQIVIAGQYFNEAEKKKFESQVIRCEKEIDEIEKFYKKEFKKLKRAVFIEVNCIYTKHKNTLPTGIYNALINLEIKRTY